MEKLIEKTAYISSLINESLVIYKDPIEGQVYVFLFIELNHRTVNTPYHELMVKDITNEINLLNIQTFNASDFKLKCHSKMVITIRSASNDWIWIHGQMPLKN